MSFNRENIIWQSADGTWNRGFYDHYSTGSDDDEDYDDEWDVEYTDEFHWVTTGLRSEYDAEDAFNGPNPGGHMFLKYSDENKVQADRLDDKAAKCYDAVHRDPAYRRGYSQTPSYRGPARGRKLSAILKDLNASKLEAASNKLIGYANLPDPRIPLLEARVASMEAQGLAVTLEKIDSANAEYADSLQAKLDAVDKRAREANRFSGGYGGVRDMAEIRRKEAIRAELEDEIRTHRTPRPRPKESGADTSAAGASSYHINPETGRPNKCYASKKPCPFGGASDHFPSKAAARKGYEASRGSSF